MSRQPGPLHYDLEFLVDTTLDHASLESLHDVAEGTVVDGFTVEAQGAFPTDVVRVHGAVVKDHTRTWSAYRPPSMRVVLAASQVTVDLNAGRSRTAATTVEWYLSGPRDLRWSRFTSRERHERLVRTRGPRSAGDDKIEVSRPPHGAMPGGGGSWDHMLLRPKETLRVVVAKVPETFGPSWSSCLAIEHHHAPDTAPTEDEQDAIAEALGFVFGRQLLRVGRTTFDSLGQPLAEYACSPWGRDAVETSQAPELPPYSVRHQDMEAATNHIIRAYLRRRTELELKDVLWTVWVARRMPVGMELPVYASALERLMLAWFRSSSSRSKGVYMAKAEFDKCTKAELALVEERFRGATFGDRIMRRMRGAFQMGVNDRFEVFFDEIGLPIADGELAIIRSRNAAAHGGSTEAAGQYVADLGRGYYTLIHRCLLKLLGGVSGYIDYSARGFPQVPIETPLGIALPSKRSSG